MPLRKGRRPSNSLNEAASDQKRTRSSQENNSSKAESKSKKTEVEKSEQVQSKPPRIASGATSSSKSPNVEKTFKDSLDKQASSRSDSSRRPSPRVSARNTRKETKEDPDNSEEVQKKSVESVQRASQRTTRHRSSEELTSNSESSKAQIPIQNIRRGRPPSANKEKSKTSDASRDKSAESPKTTPRPRGRSKKFQPTKPIETSKEKPKGKALEDGNEEKQGPVTGESLSEEKPCGREDKGGETLGIQSSVISDHADAESASANQEDEDGKNAQYMDEKSQDDENKSGKVQSSPSQPEDKSMEEGSSVKCDMVTIGTQTQTVPRKKRPSQSGYHGQQPSVKKQKSEVQVKAKEESETVSPRKSSRQRKLSRWFEDMEVSFGKKKSPEAKGRRKVIQTSVPTSIVVESILNTPEDILASSTETEPAVQVKVSTSVHDTSSQEKDAPAPDPTTSPSTPNMTTVEGTQTDISDEEEELPEAVSSKSCIEKNTVDGDETQSKYIIPLVLSEPLCEPAAASEKPEAHISKEEVLQAEASTEKTEEIQQTIVLSQPKADKPIPDTYRGLTYTSVVLPAEQTDSSDPMLKTISVDIQGAGEGGKAQVKKQEFVIVRLPEGVAIQQDTTAPHKMVDDEVGVQYSVNEADGTYKCLDCDYITNKKPNWYKHKKRHMDVKPYACDVCQYRSTTSSNLKRHMNIHRDVRSHECERCGLTFRQKIHLLRHVKYKHEEKSVQCPLCDYVCANENPDLKIHIKRRHERPKEMSADGGFTCDECGLVAISRKDYRQHLKFHRKGPELKLFCEHCSFVTDCESRMNRHMMIHTKVKPFRCGLCDYKGTQKEHVVRHMKSQHQVEMPDKSISRVGRDKQGNSDVALAALGISDDSMSNPPTPSPSDQEKKYDKADFSSRDKIFACNHCTMKFAKLINLYKHLHTQHRSIMPTATEEFSCVVCEFRTTSKKNLLVHMRKHNLLDQSPPTHVYSCVLCSYVNPKRRNLFQHMKKKHKIEIVMKDDGSANCFIAENSNLGAGSGEGGNENLMTVGDVVTASTSDTQIQVVTDNGPSGSVQRLVSISDLTNALALPQNTDGVVYIDQGSSSKAVTQMDLADLQLESINVQHEAAEAIQGLQALAEQSQRHILEAPIIEQLQGSVPDTQVELSEQVLTEQVEESQVMEVNQQQVVDVESESAVESEEGMSSSGEERPSIQLTSDQLMNLSSGDYVEINGEMYKVEFTTEDSSS